MLKREYLHLKEPDTLGKMPTLLLSETYYVFNLRNSLPLLIEDANKSISFENVTATKVFNTYPAGRVSKRHTLDTTT